MRPYESRAIGGSPLTYDLSNIVEVACKGQLITHFINHLFERHFSHLAAIVSSQDVKH